MFPGGLAARRLNSYAVDMIIEFLAWPTEWRWPLVSSDVRRRIRCRQNGLRRLVDVRLLGFADGGLRGPSRDADHHDGDRGEQRDHHDLEVRGAVGSEERRIVHRVISPGLVP